MVTLSTSMIVALLIAGGITTLAMLSVFSNVIGHETQLHDLRNRVKDLQFQHLMYLARLNGQISEENPIAEAIEAEEIFDEPTHSTAIDQTQPTGAQSLPAETESVVAA